VSHHRGVSRPIDQFRRARDVVARSEPLLQPALESVIDGLAGQPRAQSYDPSTRGPVLYCETHEGDLADCPPELLCRGVPVDVASDPTGDAAVGHDPCRVSERRIRQLVSRLERVADELYAELVGHQSRPANVVERKATEAANDKGACEVCARSDVYNPAIVTASTAKDNLPRPYRLCRWHMDFALSYGRLPNEVEDKRHHDGARVHVRAS
jgi:hypothetical protein